jgi:hypothetical protein
MDDIKSIVTNCNTIANTILNQQKIIYYFIKLIDKKTRNNNNYNIQLKLSFPKPSLNIKSIDDIRFFIYYFQDQRQIIKIYIYDNNNNEIIVNKDYEFSNDKDKYTFNISIIKYNYRRLYKNIQISFSILEYLLNLLNQGYYKFGYNNPFNYQNNFKFKILDNNFSKEFIDNYYAILEEHLFYLKQNYIIIDFKLINKDLYIYEITFIPKIILILLPNLNELLDNMITDGYIGENDSTRYIMGNILRNSDFEYNLIKEEISKSKGNFQKLSRNSHSGKILKLLMENLEKSVSYNKLCEELGIEYKPIGDSTKDKDADRQVNLAIKELKKILGKIGFTKEYLTKLIVTRNNGYMMRNILQLNNKINK